MDEDNKVVADARDSFGKGAARKIRAAGKIPAVLYGHGTDPQHLTLPGHQVGLLIRKANALLDLQIASPTLPGRLVPLAELVRIERTSGERNLTARTSSR